MHKIKVQYTKRYYKSITRVIAVGGMVAENEMDDYLHTVFPKEEIDQSSFHFKDDEFYVVEEFVEDDTPETFYLISPDGFTLTPYANEYTSIQEAKEATDRWVEGYKRQGHYTTARGEKIPIDQLASRVRYSPTPYLF